MTSVTLEPRNLLVFLSSRALLLGVPTVASAHGGAAEQSAAAPAAPGSAEAQLREFESEAIGAVFRSGARLPVAQVRRRLR